MKINQLRAGTILSYIQMLLNLIIGLAYTPVMLRLLGQSEYGLYNTIASTISMLSILSLGFNSSYIRFFARYRSENKEEAIAKLNGLFLLIFLIIATVALVCGVFLACHLDLIFADGLTAQEYQTARILMLLLTVNLMISFPMSVFSSIISAHERYVFLKLIGMLKTVVGPLITLPLLLMGFRSVAMVSVTLGIAVITDIIYLVYARKVLSIRFLFKSFEKGMFRELLVFTSFIAINMVVDQINSNMGKFLLGRFKGTEAVAVYSVGYTLYQYYMMFSTSISGVFSPRIHKIVNNTGNNRLEQKVQLTELFIKVGRIQFIVLSLVASGVVFFGKTFISFWAGKGYEDAYYVAVMLIFSATTPLMQNIGIEIQRAQNSHRFRSIVYIFMAGINLLLIVMLCPRYGVIGAVIGTSASLIIANGFVMNVYYHKRCNVDILAFWKSILRLSLGLIIPLIFGIFIQKHMNTSSVFMLLKGIVAYTLVYCASMWYVGMNTYEKALVRKPIRRFLRYGLLEREK